MLDLKLMKDTVAGTIQGLIAAERDYTLYSFRCAPTGRDTIMYWPCETQPDKILHRGDYIIATGSWMYVPMSDGRIHEVLYTYLYV